MAKNFKSPQDLCRRAARKAKRVAQRAGRRLTGRKMLTVVIPLYNAMPYFKKTVASILEQTYDLGEVEVLVMDDGSTDGSMEYAKEVAAQHPKLFRVVECGRTGGPSIPRNMGIEQAKGKYIFFCDADDYFGEEAFGRMLKHAQKWQSDVLLVKVFSPDGRSVPTAQFKSGRNVARADLYSSDVYGTLGPIKLFRASLVKQGNVEFPPDIAIREDELFTTAAYLDASIISVAADYDYYAITSRTDELNLSNKVGLDFERDFTVFGRLLRLLETNADMAKVDAKILPRVFRSSWMACAKAIAECNDDERAAADFERLRVATQPYVRRPFVQVMPSSMRLLLLVLSHGDLPFFAGLAKAVEVTPNGSFERYRVLEGEVSQDGAAVVWTQSFGGCEYSLEVDPSVVVCSPIKGMPFPVGDVDDIAAIPFEVYHEALDAVSERAPFVNARAQVDILKNLAPYLKHYVGHEERSQVFDADVLACVKGKMAALMERLSSECVMSPKNTSMGFDHKVALLNRYFGESPSMQKVYVRRVYPEKRLLRCQCFGEMPSVMVGDRSDAVVSVKSSARMFLGEPLFYTQEFLVGYDDDSDGLRFRFEGDVPVAVDVNGKSFENGAPTKWLVDYFTKDWGRYKQEGDTWIIMDRDVCADDNGEHFYRYMMKEHPEQRCLFALRKSSADWPRLESEGFALVDFGSPEYEEELRKCSTIVSSHIDKYVSSYFGDKYLYSKRIVFLQHGVIKDDLSSWLNTKAEMDLMVTTTRAEYESIVADGSTYRLLPEEVVLSGLPRHDALLARAAALVDNDAGGASCGRYDGKTLLVMPTWRNNLVGEAKGNGNEHELLPDFADSQYARAWGSFLGSSFVRNLASEGMRVVFFPHANIAPYIDAELFEVPEFVEYVSNYGEASIQELFLDADLFVTDYSSAVFDVAFLGKPCFYYQFDSEDGRPKGYHFAKGYYDYRKDGFGPAAATQDRLEESMRSCIEGDFSPSTLYQVRAAGVLGFRDGNNCGRIYEAIVARS